MARPVSAFREFPVVKQAYTHIRERLKTMIRNANRPELGAIDPPLWHYIHSCVPAHFVLPELGKAATGIGLRCKEMVMPLLVSGQISSQDYAARIMDSVRFEEFIRHWIGRELGSRPLGKQRGQSPPTASASDLAA